MNELQINWETEALHAKMHAIMLLEYLKEAVKCLNNECRKYAVTPAYLESTTQRLEQVIQEYEDKLKNTVVPG